MNLFAAFQADLVKVIEGLVAEGKLSAADNLNRLTVEPPRDASHGDMATNAAMVLAKGAGMKPRDLAELIAEALRGLDSVTEVEIAGPGFLNIRFAPDYWRQVVKAALEAGVSFGDSQMGQGRAVNVEYVSANPTGPMHVGHCRGAVFGDALASLLAKAGHDVAREYYINDAGAQVDVLARSAHLRYREALGEEIGEIPEGLYPGDYLIPVGQALKDQFGDRLHNLPEDQWLDDVKAFTVDQMMGLIREDLAALNINFDVFTSEKTLHDSGKVEAAIKTLEDKGLIYEGVLEPPKGKLPDDWEERPQTLFKATDFGDDVDRPLKKSDGSPTYFAADIAYHQDKFARGFQEQIDVWGADHGGYIKRMQAATRAITDDSADLDVKICQLVHLFRDGEPVRMSKRAGSFVTLRDVVDEVGADVVRFMMLFRKNDAALDFDFARVKDQSKDNPVFYVQYAHARICSVLRNAAEAYPDLSLDDGALAGVDLAALTHEAELELIKAIAEWPRQVEAAAAAHEPHRIAFAIHNLATQFHQFWNRGKEDPGLRFILTADDGLDADQAQALTLARLALIRAIAIVIASGLGILGVEPVTEMR